jgi:hypothetical protein
MKKPSRKMRELTAIRKEMLIVVELLSAILIELKKKSGK